MSYKTLVLGIQGNLSNHIITLFLNKKLLEFIKNPTIKLIPSP